MEHQIKLLTPEVANQYLKSLPPGAGESIFRDDLDNGLSHITPEPKRFSNSRGEV